MQENIFLDENNNNKNNFLKNNYTSSYLNATSSLKKSK